MLSRINESCQLINQQITQKPDTGIILGTGLGKLVDDVEITQKIPYKSIPNFPVSTVEGHPGNLIFGKLSGRNVVIMQGRFHYYEGYSMQEITFPVQVMKFLGIDLLILSNAAGGLNPAYRVGDIMVIEDHINLMWDNPLIGKNDDKIGQRFPDMSAPYDQEIISMALKIASENNITCHAGVYAGVKGPAYETPAEYKYLRIIGADAVGMSTVPEVIAARHMGLRCLAFSVISDLGVEGKIKEISHQEVIFEARKIEPRLAQIIKNILPLIN